MSQFEYCSAPRVHALNPAGGIMLAVEPLGDIMAWLAETGPKGWALAGRCLSVRCGLRHKSHVTGHMTQDKKLITS